MLTFLDFTRKLPNVKLIKIKLDLLINYKDFKLRLADRNKGMIAAGIVVVAEIIAKIQKNLLFYR
jgi:hypothetical protein